MDFILLISVISLILISILYGTFLRFVKKMTSDQGRILSRTKKQAEMIVDTADKQEWELDEALAASREKMVAAFEMQVARDATRMEEEVHSRLAEKMNAVFSRVDGAVAEALKKSDADIRAYKKQKIETLDGEVWKVIKIAAKTSIARGLPLEVHEKIVEQALKEAVSDISI